jgi:plastocyanin
MRDRVALPILLPVLVLGAIFMTIFAFGHVLLEVQETSGMGWLVASVAATLVFAFGAIIASQPRLPAWVAYGATALPAAVIISIGLYLLIEPAPPAEEGAGTVAAAIAPPGPIDEVATDNRFSNTALTIIAGQQYTLNFTNRGVALHNWAIQGISGPDGRPIATELLTGGRSQTINFTVPNPGTYTFICDVHPVEMRGTLTVVTADAAAAAGGGGGGSAGPGTIRVNMTDNKFDPVNIVANANEQTSLTAVNNGQALHNVHVLNVKSTNGQDIVGKLLPAKQSETIQFTIATPGTYDFICDVHPVEMRGKLTVR